MKRPVGTSAQHTARSRDSAPKAVLYLLVATDLTLHVPIQLHKGSYNNVVGLKLRALMILASAAPRSDAVVVQRHRMCDVW